jgi:hypothetical protein
MYGPGMHKFPVVQINNFPVYMFIVQDSLLEVQKFIEDTIEDEAIQVTVTGNEAS